VPTLSRGVVMYTAMKKSRIAEVWHGATENGPLNDGQIPNPIVVRVAPGTGTIVSREIGGRRETAA
jgi:hypothetical protein